MYIKMILSAKLWLRSSIIVSFHFESLHLHQPTAAQKLFRPHILIVSIIVSDQYATWDRRRSASARSSTTLFQRLGFAMFTLPTWLIILVTNRLCTTAGPGSYLGTNGPMSRGCAVFCSTHTSRSNGDQEARTCVSS